VTAQLKAAAEVPVRGRVSTVKIPPPPSTPNRKRRPNQRGAAEQPAGERRKSTTERQFPLQGLKCEEGRK